MWFVIKVFLFAGARSLVLDLVKYLHISRVQSGQGLTDSFVSEIAPMPQTVVQEVKGEGEELPSIAELVMVRVASPVVGTLKVPHCREL